LSFPLRSYDKQTEGQSIGQALERRYFGPTY